MSTMFDGLGASSKNVICGKKTHPLAEIHRKAGFRFGTDFWDDAKSRQASAAKQDFKDPQVTYIRNKPPYKNFSVVELKQGVYDPERQFKSEMVGEFRGVGAEKQRSFPEPPAQVNLGDFPRKFETQYRADNREGQSLPPTYNSNFKPHEPPHHDLINGEKRNYRDPRFCDPFGRITRNYCYEYDKGIRDPVLGVTKPRPSHPKQTSAEIVAKANAEVPVLRSLGAVRPHIREQK